MFSAVAATMNVPVLVGPIVVSVVQARRRCRSPSGTILSRHSDVIDPELLVKNSEPTAVGVVNCSFLPPSFSFWA